MTGKISEDPSVTTLLGVAYAGVQSGANVQIPQAVIYTARVPASSAAAVSLTGTTNETTLATVTIPANSMGANGVVRITVLWSYTNSGNTKTARVKFGGTTFSQQTPTTTAAAQFMVLIRNRNATNSQVGAPVANAGLATGSGSVTTASIDTTAAVTMLITGQLTNSGETIQLEGYIVEVLYSA